MHRMPLELAFAVVCIAMEGIDTKSAFFGTNLRTQKLTAICSCRESTADVVSDQNVFSKKINQSVYNG